MRLFAFIVAFSLGLGAACAQGTTDAQRTISAQVEAFARDDAEAAYRLAAPGIQALFPDPASFLNMVRTNYAAVYRPRRFEFAASQEADGKVIQQVELTDSDGGAWTALYTLERQPDGSLKITGCTLLRAGQAV